MYTRQQIGRHHDERVEDTYRGHDQRLAKEPGTFTSRTTQRDCLYRASYPHTISPQRSAEPLEKYNCVMHALGLVGRMREYPHPLLVAKTAFVSYLVAEVLQPCEPEAGSLVTWSSQAGLQVEPVLAKNACAPFRLDAI
jgi:hypothetical protein